MKARKIRKRVPRDYLVRFVGEKGPRASILTSASQGLHVHGLLPEPSQIRNARSNSYLKSCLTLNFRAFTMSLARSLTLIPLSISNLASSSSSSGGGCGSHLFSFHGSGRTLGLKFEGNSRERAIFKVNAAVPKAYAVGVGQDLPEDYGEWFPKVDPLELRRAGILLHPSSLSGPYGIGDLGKEALRFLDWLHDSGCSIWQVLPLVPPGRKANEDGSPYAGLDANCGNTLLISLEGLVEDGLLRKDELPEPMDDTCVKFDIVADIKDPLIAKAAKRLIGSKGELKKQLEDFQRDPEISGWLEDAAFFAAIDNVMKTFTWYEWPEPLKNRHLGALEEIYQSQKDYDKNGYPDLVSGVPPDAFSETGQLWGSPLYDWKAMEKDSFSWWVKRIKRALNIYDEFRIDHFRGFAGFWAVPSESKVATHGRWKAGPNKAFFDAIFKAVGKINIIAEDLGVITEDVVHLRKAIGAPGMAVLQFGKEQLLLLWVGGRLCPTKRNLLILFKQVFFQVLRFLGKTKEEDISWAMIRSALSSVARIAIIPMQDVLRLGSSARMNTPAVQMDVPKSARGFDKLETEAKELKNMLSMYNRLCA
ncbi:4-alpha-glucanotransferase dpe1, chloroplastic/amyloplastic [Asimina triloba]